MCDRVVSEDPFMLKYCVDRYKIQKMFHDTVDDCLSALKFAPNLFVTSKMIGNFHEALLFINDILFFDENFSNVIFFANKMGILILYIDKMNLDGTDFYEDDPKTIIIVRNLA